MFSQSPEELGSFIQPRPLVRTMGSRPSSTEPPESPHLPFCLGIKRPEAGGGDLAELRPQLRPQRLEAAVALAGGGYGRRCPEYLHLRSALSHYSSPPRVGGAVSPISRITRAQRS